MGFCRILAREHTRPWRIDSVYRFDAVQLDVAQRARGVRGKHSGQYPQPVMGGGADLPRANNLRLCVSPQQAAMLELFQSG